ncbi:MAG TPA: hypothetical protein VIL52_00160 [Bacteroidota bacterium]
MNDSSKGNKAGPGIVEGLKLAYDVMVSMAGFFLSKQEEEFEASRQATEKWLQSLDDMSFRALRSQKEFLENQLTLIVDEDEKQSFLKQIDAISEEMSKRKIEINKTVDETITKLWYEGQEAIVRQTIDNKREQAQVLLDLEEDRRTTEFENTIEDEEELGRVLEQLHKTFLERRTLLDKQYPGHKTTDQGERVSETRKSIEKLPVTDPKSLFGGGSTGWSNVLPGSSIDPNKQQEENKEQVEEISKEMQAFVSAFDTGMQAVGQGINQWVGGAFRRTFGEANSLLEIFFQNFANQLAQIGIQAGINALLGTMGIPVPSGKIGSSPVPSGPLSNSPIMQQATNINLRGASSQGFHNMQLTTKISGSDLYIVLEKGKSNLLGRSLR